MSYKTPAIKKNKIQCFCREMLIMTTNHFYIKFVFTNPSVAIDSFVFIIKIKYINEKFRLRQQLALSYVFDSGVPMLYPESKSIPLVLSLPWVHIYSMSPCLYHVSMSIPWVHVSTISPCLYHKSMSIQWVNVYTIIPYIYHESLPIPWVQKFK